jgi:hypothetical protein
MKTLPEIQLTDRATMLLVKHMDANPHLSIDQIIEQLICNALAVYEIKEALVGLGFQMPNPSQTTPANPEVDKLLSDLNKVRGVLGKDDFFTRRLDAYSKAATLLGVTVIPRGNEDNWNQIIDALESYRPDFRTFTLDDES